MIWVSLNGSIWDSTRPEYHCPFLSTSLGSHAAVLPMDKFKDPSHEIDFRHFSRAHLNASLFHGSAGKQINTVHAMDRKTWRSGSGYFLILCGAAIAWKSCIQPIVATSLTKAEFYARVTCAKATKYLHSVLEELDALQEGLTPLYINNEAAIAMINKNWPTTSAWHIEIQHLAI